MYLESPLFIEELDFLRRSVLRLENQENKKAQLWR